MYLMAESGGHGFAAQRPSLGAEVTFGFHAANHRLDRAIRASSSHTGLPQLHPMLVGQAVEALDRGG
jgi:hypothetical protein